jgi:hypothetical protein
MSLPPTEVLAAITALAAAGAALAALVALQMERRRAATAHGVAALLKLDETFHSEAFRGYRARAAGQLLEETPRGGQLTHELVAIAGFFQQLGSLVNHNVIDAHLAYKMFGYWVVNYYWCMRDNRVLSPGASGPPVMYMDDFIALYRAFARMQLARCECRVVWAPVPWLERLGVERLHRHGGPTCPTPTFLAHERNLSSPHTARGQLPRAPAPAEAPPAPPAGSGPSAG